MPDSGLRIAVLNEGAVGPGSAALLAERGHTPVLWSSSVDRLRSTVARDGVKAGGALDYTFVPTTVTNCATAVDDADAVMTTVSGTAYRGGSKPRGQIGKQMAGGFAATVLMPWSSPRYDHDLSRPFFSISKWPSNGCWRQANSY